jgi:signal transduction histidine kinase
LVCAEPFIILGLAHLFSARLFSFDLFLIPMMVAIAFAMISVQLVRLSRLNSSLASQLVHSSGKMNSLKADQASARLNCSLKLLDTMLSPEEVVVFQLDSSGALVTVARLRALPTNSLDSSRISSWREGISLCERAIALDSMVTQKVGGENLVTNVAVPLQHGDQSVGALLLRIPEELVSDDRALLAAVAAQLARNLQRQEAAKSFGANEHIGLLSATVSQNRLDSLAVINGLMLEQRCGVNALAEIQEGIAIAYLDGTLAYINPPLLRLVGLSEDEIGDLTLFDLLDRLRTDVFDEPTIAVRRVLQTGEAYEGELRLPQGGIFSLRMSLVTDHVGRPRATAEPLCLAITVRNVTHLKAYEELKSDMISLMSHELRTPLTSINGFAELLTSDQTLPEPAKEFVTIIANESQRLSRMINTFLAVTQLERKDRQEVLKIPLRLDDVVRETVLSLQPSAKKKRIRLVEQPNQRIPPVAADKGLISQAVKNLVSNAIKYSPERTTVTVSTALEAEAVRVSVEDRGYGIPAESRDRVWEKFYRVVREGQEKDEESTGLGLSFVREVVEQHGGAVALESEEGQGSKFSFTLPRL